MGKNALPLGKPRFKTLTYELDLEDKTQGPKIKFTGDWSPRELDRIMPRLRRALMVHKAEQAKKLGKEAKNDNPRPEWPYK